MKTKLSLGKLPSELLLRYVLSKTGATTKQVLVSPAIGLDFGVVKLRSGCLIASSDPVTGASENIGARAVNVSANDIATSGNRPQFMQSVLLFPENASEGLVRQVSSQVHGTAKELGVSVLGGHTELTPTLNRTIVVVTMFAIVEAFVTSAQAREGDTIMLTKTAGLEGTSILAADSRRLGLKLPATTIKRARALVKNLSVVSEARTAFVTGKVHAMHDCTEGGLLGAVYEMASASHLGFEIYDRRIPILKETRAICDAARVDPLKLMSSGALLIAVQRGGEKQVHKALSRLGVPVVEIGRFTGGSGTLIRSNGKSETIAAAPQDELWRLAG